MKKIFFSLLLLYGIGVLYLLFFGFGRKPYDYNIVRLIPLFSTFNFIKNAHHLQDIFINVFGNIVLFMPFGFLGWFFPKFQKCSTIFHYFVIGIIVIETIQYFSRMGVFDIDDVILNTFGMYLGFLIYKKWFVSFFQ